MSRIDFQTGPEKYHHWRLEVDGHTATLSMDVDENGGLFGDYELKLNSYDLGVDIELYDALERLRFEHPGVKVVVLRSAKDRVFCAGANIKMLSQASHAHKVNFCKFTNETRNALEVSGKEGGQHYICAINGTAAGGGYELALAADYIVLVDDGSASVSLPEVPLLAVLPGTGGLTRVTDKRKVRRDLADVFCTLEEGVRGDKAVKWRLIDETVAATRLEPRLQELADQFAAGSDRPDDASGVSLTPLKREFGDDLVRYEDVTIDIDRALNVATVTVHVPAQGIPGDVDAALAQGAGFWPLRLGRSLEDAILHLRANEPEVGVLILKSAGDPAQVLGYDEFLRSNAGHWFIREVNNLWRRTMKRLDLTSRTLIALGEPGSCFAGFLAEFMLAADRSFMFIGQREGDNRPVAELTLSDSNFGAYVMSNGLSRLETRFLGEPKSIDAAKATIGTAIDAAAAEEAGLITFAYDDIDWDDEIRIMIEERASFSPDGLTGLEANLRFAGPETMETKIFGRLTAWQNWIFQRPNAVGPEGALRQYGTGARPDYDRGRV